jgi:hypothetical protein
MNANKLYFIVIGCLAFNVGCTTSGGSATFNIDSEDSEFTPHQITANADYSDLQLNHVYNSRSNLLFLAAFQWSKLGLGLDSVNIIEVSDKGLFPFWIIDPKTNNPVRILNSGNPTGSDVALIPEMKALSCKLNSMNFSQNGNSYVVDNYAKIMAGYDSLPIEQLIELNHRTVDFPPTEWGNMMDGVHRQIQGMVPLYVAANQSMPLSLENLLGECYFINQDFLENASSLIASGEFSFFECGVIPEQNVLYFDFERLEPMGFPNSIQYIIGDDGFDLFDRQRIIETIPSDGLNLVGDKVILISDEMLANPDENFDESVIRPLSDFYIPE